MNLVRHESMLVLMLQLSPFVGDYLDDDDDDDDVVDDV